MHSVLEKTDGRRVVVLHGLGGIGKTQLVAAYLKTYHTHYSAVIWLNAKDKTSLQQSFARAATRILRKYPALMYIKAAIESRDLPTSVQAIHQWLNESNNDQWLLVFDNYDNPKFEMNDKDTEVMASGLDQETGSQETTMISLPFDIRPFFPDAYQGAIIVTTRASTVKIGKMISLKKLTDVRESLDILSSASHRQIVEDDNEDVWYELLQQVELEAPEWLKEIVQDHMCYIHISGKGSAVDGISEWYFHNLGLLYADQGRLKEAEDMYNRALQGKEKAWGPEHTSTLDIVNNLAILYKAQGRLKDAEDMYNRALQGYEKAWGPEHTSTLDTVNNLASLYHTQGRLKDAEDMHNRALRGYEKTLRVPMVDTYPPALRTMENLGDLLRYVGRPEEAQEYYLRAEAGVRLVYGSE
ncbi:hypothetical protein S40288_10274, partial [Stachybotrys chartarum IBT 40288]